MHEGAVAITVHEGAAAIRRRHHMHVHIRGCRHEMHCGIELGIHVRTHFYTSMAMGFVPQGHNSVLATNRV
eukprot:363729-Chlamydomonas_euryale.AAC.1